MEKARFLLVIDLDGKCNCRCRFCLKQSALLHPRKRTLSGVLTQIRQAIHQGIDRVDFFGGEPTLYPFLKKAMLFAHRKGLTVSLATNATRFASKQYTRFFFDGFPLEYVRTTLYSHRAVVHDRITRVPGSWQKTVDGIRNMQAFNVKLTVNIVINRWNFKALGAWTRSVYDLGIRSVKYSALQMSGGAVTSPALWVADDEYGVFLLDAIRQASETGFYFIELEQIPDVLVRRVRALGINVNSHW